MWLQWEGNKWWKTTVWILVLRGKIYGSGKNREISTLDINLEYLLNFKHTLVVPESTVLSLADRWTRGPLSASSSPSGSLFFLSPARFLHRRRLVCRASRPYRGSARRASCWCSVHSPRGPVRYRHCSWIRLRTPAIGDERRWWTLPTVHRARAIKTAGVPLSSSSHLASLLLLLPPLLLTKARARH